MNNKAEREAFESWCKSVGYSTSPDYIDKRLYWYAETSAAWDAWQAAITRQQVSVQGLLDSLNGMVEMMDSGDEHGEGSDWYLKAVEALQTFSKIKQGVK